LILIEDSPSTYTVKYTGESTNNPFQKGGDLNEILHSRAPPVLRDHLHARGMYACIIDQSGEIVFLRDLRTEPTRFISAIAPYREDIVVCVECIFTWYWLVDL
jgi:hypothetical protein